MLPFLGSLDDQNQLFNLFNYITFRTGGAIVTALFFAFLIGKPLIDWLRLKQGKGQPIREDGPASHLLTKKGTPTMGGFIILFSLAIASLLWADLTNPYVWAVLLVTFGFGAVGFIDDFAKVTKQKADGLSGRVRLLLEFAIALGATLIMLAAQWTADPGMAGRGEQFWQALLHGGDFTSVALPFFKDLMVPLGGFFLAFAMFVIVGAGNAVNMTDGLDGLAIVPVMIAAATFGLIAYLTGNANFARYLQIHYVQGAGELAIICGALIGAGLGFLWFNAPPAMIFMGDTGSLALGGALGAIAVATKHEIVLAIVGGLFVLETMSVIIQVTSYKLTGKRVFRMAPLHHHFEQKGWKESTVVVRFWIISVVLALVGLATLKLR